MTSRVLAQAMALNKPFTKGKPVLLIDLDPQGSTSRRWQLLKTDFNDGSSYPKDHPDLLDEEQKNSSVCDLWLSLIAKDYPKPLGDSVIPLPYETTNPMIHVVPADTKLMSYAVSVSVADHYKLAAALRSWLRSKEVAETYSCVIIDTQPSITSLLDAALTAGTHCYVPFVPEPQSADGIFSVISYIAMQQQKRGSDVPLVLLGLLPNMVKKTKLHNAHLNAFKRDEVYSRYLMPVSFSNSISYAETDDWRNTPQQVTDKKDSLVSIEAKRFAKYIIQRIQE
jgi:chromosome partitioning protein